MPGPYPYNNNIPQPNDQLSVSQGDLLTNFQAIANFLNENHVDFAQADAGKHKWVTFPRQPAVPAIFGTDTALFNMVPAAPAPLTGISETFVHKFVAAGTLAIDIPFTASVLSYSNPLPAQESYGWTYLPSGIILKWGTVNVVAGFNGPLNYDNVVSPSIPAFQNVFQVFLTPLNAGLILSITSHLVSWTNTTFTCEVNTPAANTKLNFLAIGY